MAWQKLGGYSFSFEVLKFPELSNPNEMPCGTRLVSALSANLRASVGVRSESSSVGLLLGAPK